MKCIASDKLGPKSDKCKFVENPKETKGYRFYHPTENKVFVARNAIFLEKEFLSKGNSGRVIDLDEVREPQTVSEPEEEPELVLQRYAVHEAVQTEQGGHEVAPPVAAQPDQGAQEIVAPVDNQVAQEPRRYGRVRHGP